MSDEEIVPAPTGATNPGAQDGVGEHAHEGLGSGGVQRIEGEFADLEDEAGSDTRGEPPQAQDS